MHYLAAVEETSVKELFGLEQRTIEHTLHWAAWKELGARSQSEEECARKLVGIPYQRNKTAIESRSLSKSKKRNCCSWVHDGSIKIKKQRRGKKENAAVVALSKDYDLFFPT